MILYIAGPMTGYEKFNFGAFDSAQAALRRAGYETLNPARHGDDSGRTWADYMRLGLADVIASDGIAVLPDAALSRGARLEIHVAVALDLPIKTVAQWVAP